MKLLIYLLVFVLTASTLSSQGFLERIKKKTKESIERKTEERVEKKIDEKIDESLDSVEESMESSKEDSQTSDNERSNPGMKMFEKMMGGADNANINEMYNFSNNFLMDTEIFHGDDSQMKTKVRMFFDKDIEYIGMETDLSNMKNQEMDMDNVFIIFDIPNQSMITMTGKKDEGGVALVMNIPDSEDIKDLQNDDNLSNSGITKTDKTRKILGYNCYLYIIEDDEHYTEAWITDELPFDQFKAFNFMQQQNENVLSKSAYQNLPNGFMLEAETKTKTDKTRNVIKMLEINLNQKKSISTKGYTVMNMSKFMPNENK